MASYSVSDINGMELTRFVQLFGSVFEETPKVAEQAWHAKPFQDIDDLHHKMVNVVAEGMTRAEKLKLIRSHPELGEKGKMAAASVQEQASVGLNKIKKEEDEQISRLNSVYREKFGFPFVMAVKGQTLSNILMSLEARLTHSVEEEMARSLLEIYKIARFRLDDLVTH